MKLLVGVDLSESTEKVVKKVEEIATALSAKVWLLHSTKAEPADLYLAAQEPDAIGIEPDPQLIRDALARRFHNEHRQIQEIAERLRKAGLEASALLVEGAAVSTILKEASKLDADMIVIGSHGRGRMHQLLLGSVSEGIVHKSECPILVVPTHERS
jgi:nucleotide-binding universal stress UspA family protein